MRIFLRIFLTLYILAVMFITGVVLGCAWGLIDSINPRYWIEMLYGNTTVIWVVSVIGVAILILSLALMFSGIRRRKPKVALVRTAEGGTISITVNALEEMAMRFISENQTVRNVKAAIAVRDGKANVHVKMTVADGTNIPEVLQSLQTGLKAHIELLAGIQVNKIMLLVEKTAQVAKARVE